MTKYNAMLIYNSKDGKFVANLYEYLTNAHLKIFYDKKCVRLGKYHTKVIEEALNNIDTILVCIGPEGRGPWQEDEIYQAIWHSIEKKTNVIPIILPGAKITDENIPGSLKTRSACIFKKDDDEERIQDIVELLLDSSWVDEADEFVKPLSKKEYDAILQKTLRFYNLNASKFYDKWNTHIPEEQIEHFCKRIPLKAKILDAGCGPGHHSRIFKNKGYCVTGIDLSSGAIKIAQQHKIKTEFFHMDMRETSFQKNSFDAIWACASLVHVDDDYMPGLFREYKRIVKPGGLIGITTMVGNKSAVEDDDRFFQGFTKARDFEKILIENEFEIVGVEKNLLKKNTHDKKKVSNWFTFIVQTPSERRTIIHYKKNNKK
jgi:2-polyprenyl-3-methyl-5-hydroxy-6-metoxy-1,4-benzoquinol methylase